MSQMVKSPPRRGFSGGFAKANTPSDAELCRRHLPKGRTWYCLKLEVTI